MIELSSLLAEGGKMRRCRYCSSPRMARARDRCAALASPSTFAMVGDNVPPAPQAVQREDWCRGVPPRRGRFAPSLLNYI